MRSMDMGCDRERSIVLRLAIPAMFGQLINVLYGIIDRIFIGNLEGIGELALAGVGVCAPITTLIISISYLVGTGGSPLMMMRLGEKNEDKAKQILANGFLLLSVLGILIPLLFLIFLKPLLSVFGATPSIMEYSYSYMKIYLYGSFFAIIASGLNQFIIAQGFSGIGMATMVLGAIINMILDPILIFTLGMGVTGAALATIIAQFCSCLFAFLFLLSKKPIIRLSFRKYSPTVCSKILKLGISPFIILASDSILGICVNCSLKYTTGPMAEKYIAVVTISNSFFQLLTMPLLGISGGTQGVLSYNFGAKNTKRVKNSEKSIVKLALIFTTSFFFLSFFLSKPFIGVFTKDIEIIALCQKANLLLMIGIIPLSFQYCFVDALTALGIPKGAATLSLTRKTIIIGLTWLLPILLGGIGVFYAEMVGDLLASIITSVVFLMVFPKILKNRLSKEEIR